MTAPVLSLKKRKGATFRGALAFNRRLKKLVPYAVLHKFSKVPEAGAQDRIPWGFAPLAAENAPSRRIFGLSPPGGKSAFPQTPFASGPG